MKRKRKQTSKKGFKFTRRKTKKGLISNFKKVTVEIESDEENIQEEFLNYSKISSVGETTLNSNITHLEENFSSIIQEDFGVENIQRENIPTSPGVYEETQSVFDFNSDINSEEIEEKKDKNVFEFRKGKTFLNRVFTSSSSKSILFDLHASVFSIDVWEVLKLNEYKPSSILNLESFNKPIFSGSKFLLSDLIYLVTCEKVANFDSKKSVTGFLKIFSIMLSELKNSEIVTTSNYIFQKITDNTILKIGYCNVCEKYLYVNHLLKQQNNQTIPHCPNCGNETCYSRRNQSGSLILKEDSCFYYISFIKFFCNFLSFNENFSKGILEVFQKFLDGDIFDSEYGNSIREFFKREKDSNRESVLYIFLDLSEDGIKLFKKSSKNIDALTLKTRTILDEIFLTISIWFKSGNKNLLYYIFVEELIGSLKKNLEVPIAGEERKRIVRFFLNRTMYDLSAAWKNLGVFKGFCIGCYNLPKKHEIIAEIENKKNSYTNDFSEKPKEKRTLEKAVDDLVNKKQKDRKIKKLPYFAILNQYYGYDYFEKFTQDVLHPIELLFNICKLFWPDSILKRIKEDIYEDLRKIKEENNYNKSPTEFGYFTYLEARDWFLNKSLYFLELFGNKKDKNQKKLFILNVIIREMLLILINDDMDNREIEFRELGDLLVQKIFEIQKNKKMNVLIHMFVYRSIESTKRNGSLLANDTKRFEDQYSKIRYSEKSKNDSIYFDSFQSLNLWQSLGVFSRKYDKKYWNEKGCLDKVISLFKHLNMDLTHLIEFEELNIILKQYKNRTLRTNSRFTKKVNINNISETHPKVTLVLLNYFVSFSLNDQQIFQKLIEINTKYNSTQMKYIKTLVKKYIKMLPTSKFICIEKFWINIQKKKSMYCTKYHRESQSKNGNCIVQYYFQNKEESENEKKKKNEEKSPIYHRFIGKILHVFKIEQEVLLVIHQYKRIRKMKKKFQLPSSISKYYSKEYECVSNKPSALHIITEDNLIGHINKFCIKRNLKKLIKDNNFEVEGEVAFCFPFFSNKLRIKGEKSLFL